MKKIVLALLIVLGSIVGIQSVSAIEVIGDLLYWYSDSGAIGDWTPNATYSIKETANASSSFTTDVKTGFSAWNSAGVPNSYESVFNNGTIKVYGGLYSEIKNAFPSFSTTASGQTLVAAVPSGSYYITPSGYREAYFMANGTEIYYATDRANSKTYKHEAGHSLGWLGHSSNSGDIMYGSQTTVTQLTLRDKDHLNQVY